MKLNCIIVDDEPLARKGLSEYVREIDFLVLVGECANASQAKEMLAKSPVELLLLDIQMPHTSGLEFVRTLVHPPMVIITTAFSEYALEGYELDVIDYLVKPIPFDRFKKAVNKALDFKTLKLKAQGGEVSSDFLFVKSSGKFERVMIEDILYVEAMQNYVALYLTTGKLIVYATVSGIESQLPADRFLKVHRSYLVSISKIKSVEGNEILLGNSHIPISRSLHQEVMSRILGNNLLQR